MCKSDGEDFSSRVTLAFDTALVAALATALVAATTAATHLATILLVPFGSNLGMFGVHIATLFVRGVGHISIALSCRLPLPARGRCSAM